MKKTCTSYLTCTEEKKNFLIKDGFVIKECKKCGHRFTPVLNVDSHFEEVYSDDYFFDGKQGYPNYLEEKDILMRYGKWYAKKIEPFKKQGKLLDVGCAAGFILKGFEQCGWQCQGIEPNNTMAEYGRSELQLNITTGNLEEFTTNEKYDLINMIQVIGHFYDLDKVMQNVKQLLKDDGMVLVESWNMKSISAKLLGRHWHEYSPPSVINWFSDKTLIQLFNYYGFELVDKGYPLKRINIKHALSLLNEKLPNFFFKKKIINLLSNSVGKLKIIYPPVDVKWYLFKKNT